MKNEMSVVTTKGQLVIPARLRRRFGIRKGTLVSIVEEGGRLVLQPVTPEFIDRVKGSLKGGAAVLENLFDERRKDRF